MYRLLFLLLTFSYTLLSAQNISCGVFFKSNFPGEREFAERLKVASERLGWDISVFDEKNYKSSNKKDFNFVLCLTPKDHDFRLKREYLVLFDPEHHYFSKKGNLLSKYQDYYGYLSTYENTNLLHENLHGDFTRIYQKAWYPTVQHVPYTQVNPTRLFYFLGSWGNRLQDEKYQTLQRELAKKPYVQFFGGAKRGALYGNAYKGSLPFDGVSTVSQISDMGVCLVLHSDTHIKHRIPSGRIFEAVAASSVVISDMNPFVLKNFGDSVLYIDQNLSGEEIAENIDRHMNWIQENPETALKMAKKAHTIFEEKFLLESQLSDFYEYITIFGAENIKKVAKSRLADKVILNGLEL